MLLHVYMYCFFQCLDCVGNNLSTHALSECLSTLRFLREVAEFRKEWFLHLPDSLHMLMVINCVKLHFKIVPVQIMYYVHKRYSKLCQCCNKLFFRHLYPSVCGHSLKHNNVRVFISGTSLDSNEPLCVATDSSALVAS